MTLADVLIIAGALAVLVVGFIVALWWIDRDAPHPVLDRVGSHLAQGTPIVTLSRRPDIFDQDHRDDAA